MAPQEGRRAAAEGGTRSVHRAFDIMFLIARENQCGVTEIARTLDINKTSVSKTLRSCEARKVIVQDPSTRRYEIGPRAYAWALAYRWQHPVLRQAEGVVRALRDKTQETVSLYVRAGLSRVCVYREESPHSLRRVIGLGSRFPLHLGAAGKVLLAWLSPKEQQALLNALERDVFAETPWMKDALLAELDVIRKTGYAVSSGEREAGVTAIAAPIVVNGACVAALSCSGPSGRIAAHGIDQLAVEIIAAAKF